MWSFIAPAFRMTLVLTVLTGLIYPAVVTGVAQTLFTSNAHGSLVTAGGKVVGSALIGQNFAKPEYLHPRPSAAGQVGYDASASLASNYGPTNQKLIDRVKASAAQYRQENPDHNGPIPADALTTSASGLDPHISPANAEIQADRIAKARHVDVGRVRELILRTTDRPWLGFIGEPRVNVLLVNLALDEQLPRK
jgi:potassium-transporting ATPase KdpC subunit